MTLHSRIRGTGPALLIIAGGDGDADTCDGIVDRLTDSFTVLTYDRRGISRSPAAASVEIGIHADDACALLDDLGPAYVFGTSLGALIGLDLATRYPASVRMLIAHEPPLPQFLPDTERDDAIRAQERIERVFQERGLDAAMRALVASTGIHVADREPEALLPRPSAQRTRNLEHMLTVDTPAARRFRLDADALSAGGVRVEIGGGVRSGLGFPYRCGAAMASALDLPLVEFPGGHNGYTTHPVAFATVLHTAVASRSRAGQSRCSSPTE